MHSDSDFWRLTTNANGARVTVRMTLDQLQALGLRAVDQQTGEDILVTPPPMLAPSKAELALERDLQKLCELELHRNGITYLHLSPRAREKAGWPDLAFCVDGWPFAVELKTETGKLSSAQVDVLGGMRADGWIVRIVRDFDTFARIVRGDKNAGEKLADNKTE